MNREAESEEDALQMNLGHDNAIGVDDGSLIVYVILYIYIYIYIYIRESPEIQLSGMPNSEEKPPEESLQTIDPELPPENKASDSPKESSPTSFPTKLRDPITELNSYQMIGSVIYSNRLSESTDLSIKRYNDAYYLGELKNGRRHGQGIMRYASGRVYEGNWTSDMRHGRGYEKYANSNVYDGEFAKGKAEGKGVYSWANGEIYDGEWKAGLKNGDGVWKGMEFIYIYIYIP